MFLNNLQPNVIEFTHQIHEFRILYVLVLHRSFGFTNETIYKKSITKSLQECTTQFRLKLGDILYSIVATIKRRTI